MTEAEIRKLASEILSDIAPETDPAALAGGSDIRAALDIDSMDFLNFIIALNKRTGVAIPEEDYPKLFTMDGVVAYLAGSA
ncbi:acyl carrier protein [Chelativorans xinjiangense]|uniref:acyl carrier protein n=1 Tax=Chelativorans xinjiangense TaxID=2681485 RepID=UPI001358F741|nr:acyl carrier protein [Chelativorans xinjiangense]